MKAPKVTVACVSNVYTRVMHFESKGDVEQGHKHPYDHTTLLSSGSLRVEVDGESRDFKAPYPLFIAAHKNHKLTALEGNTVAGCIHALREVEHGKVGDIIAPDAVVTTADRERMIAALKEA